MPERDLFRRWAGVECEQYSVLGANGSNRRYVRMSAGEKRCIAALNDDVRENGAFFYFSREMSARGIRVPQLYAVSDDRRCYLQEDLATPRSTTTSMPSVKEARAPTPRP